MTEALAAALEQSDMNQSKLAQKLGCTRGFVSQVFAGGRNLTLRTISDVALALGVKPKFSVCAEDDQSRYVFESITLSQWASQRHPKIFLHPSAFPQADSERKQLIA